MELKKLNTIVECEWQTPFKGSIFAIINFINNFNDIKPGT